MFFKVKDLCYLVAIREHQHFGKAAEACHVTQPTISAQIRKLEEQLDVLLVERTRRRVRLTAAGEALAEQSERILQEHRQLDQLAARYRDPLGGRMQMGMIPTVAPYLLPIIHPLLVRHYPNLAVRIHEFKTHEILRQIISGTLDAAILALPINHKGIVEAELYREPFLFSVGGFHPKSTQSSVSLNDLEDERFLLLEDGHCLRDQALAICRNHRGLENTDFSAASLETLRQMVAANIGVTLMPALAVRPLDEVRYIPFSDDIPERAIGLCWRESSPRQELLEHMAQALAFDELPNPNRLEESQAYRVGR